MWGRTWVGRLNSKEEIIKDKQKGGGRIKKQICEDDEKREERSVWALNQSGTKTLARGRENDFNQLTLIAIFLIKSKLNNKYTKYNNDNINYKLDTFVEI